MQDQPAQAWLRSMPFVFVLIWSTGFIVARFGMPHAPPMGFLAWRYFFSIVCFGVWIQWTGVAWPKNWAQVKHLAITGVLMHGGYLGGVWLAVKAGMGAGLSALVVGLQPVLTAVWLAYRGSWVGRAQWAGLALGLTGLLLVVWQKLQLTTEVSAWTLGLTVTALLCITTGTLYQKSHVAPCDVRTASAVQLLAALALTLPLALLESEPMHWNPTLMGALAWSVLALTLGASSLLYMMIQRGAAASVTSLMYLVPPSTAFLAWLLFDEPVTGMTVLGTVCTVLGVMWVIKYPATTPANRN
ncbi:MAG: DMT family transporter [Betaproteobacteria bacterium]|nr:DMT family transporter [Betaproteobacteria bacterium]NBY04008.1 DMT family transporter [Betaproteobacteria bacterium]